MAISLIGSSISATGVHPAPSPGSRTGRTEFDSNQEILSQLLTLLLSVSAWHSQACSSAKRIFLLCGVSFSESFEVPASDGSSPFINSVKRTQHYHSTT